MWTAYPCKLLFIAVLKETLFNYQRLDLVSIPFCYQITDYITRITDKNRQTRTHCLHLDFFLRYPQFSLCPCSKRCLSLLNSQSDQEWQSKKLHLPYLFLSSGGGKIDYFKWPYSYRLLQELAQEFQVTYVLISLQIWLPYFEIYRVIMPPWSGSPDNLPSSSSGQFVD